MTTFRMRAKVGYGNPLHIRASPLFASLYRSPKNFLQYLRNCTIYGIKKNDWFWVMTVQHNGPPRFAIYLYGNTQKGSRRGAFGIAIFFYSLGWNKALICISFHIVIVGLGSIQLRKIVHRNNLLI